MSYSEWFKTHGKKHAAVMEKLTHLSDEEVIRYFRFENMVQHEPDFCPLYAKHQKCHDMEDLNCYLCACPNFRFDDAGFKEIECKRLMSYCAINSKDGAVFEGEDALHQNCTGCTVPHHEAYIKSVFDRDWFKIMRKVPSKDQS
ncbi:MAG: hypothetical protein L3J47_01645 [Sulfurovum sp.]|nr:hypothetical protein [Sulfurovum sp.]